MKIGILGTNFGFEHAKIFSKFPDVEILGIYGRNQEKLDEIHQLLHIPIYTDSQKLITHPEIDLIDVVMPTFMHKEFVIQALNAKKHVFCETPLAFSVEDAQEMLQVARQTNRTVFVGLFMLFSPEFQYTLNIAKRSSFGSIHAVFQSRRTPRIWGDMTPMLFNLMIHDFDFLYALLGKPLAISAQHVSNPTIHADQIFVTLRYSNSLVVIEGTSMVPDSYPFSMTYRVMGAQESIEVHYPHPEDPKKCQVFHYPSKGSMIEPTIPFANEYERECRYVIDYLQGKTSQKINQIEIAIHSLEMAMVATHSIATNGKWISLS